LGAAILQNRSKKPRRSVSGLLVAGLALSLSIGTAVGLAGFTFFYANGISYLQETPETCTNCHVMNEHFHAWSRGSHHAVAQCGDCHEPEGFIAGQLMKLYHGYSHTTAFTSGNFPDVLEIKNLDRRITEGNCRRCHGPIVEAIDAMSGPGRELKCIACHPSAGHLE